MYCTGCQFGFCGHAAAKWWNHIAAALLTRQQFGLVVICTKHNNVESQQGIMNGQQQVEHGRVAGWNKGPSHLKWCYNTHTRRGWLKTSSSHHIPLLWFYFDKKTSAYSVSAYLNVSHFCWIAGQLENSVPSCCSRGINKSSWKFATFQTTQA